MKICLIEPSIFSNRIIVGEVKELVEAHYSKLSGLAEKVDITSIENVDINNYDYFFVYHSKDAIELRSKGCNAFSFFLNEPESTDINSQYYSNVRSAIEVCHIVIVRSIYWFKLFPEFNYKIIYLSYGLFKNEDLLNVERRLNTSNIRLLCMGNNNPNYDELNYILANNFASKFKFNISFVNYGCEFFSKTDYQFFQVNPNCQIVCDDYNIFNDQKNTSFLNIIKNHDILLDLRSKNLEGLTSYQLKCLFSGMPCISTIFDEHPDSEHALISCKNDMKSLTDGLQYVISNWRECVSSSREFASSRDWYNIIELLYNLLTGKITLKDTANA